MKLPALFAGRRRLWLWLLVITGLMQATGAVIIIHLIQKLWAAPWQKETAGLLILFSLALLLLRIAEKSCAEQLGQEYIGACRTSLYAELMSAPISHAPKRLGVAMTRLITDAASLKNWAGSGAAGMITNSLALCGYLTAVACYWPGYLWLLIGLLSTSLLLALLLTPGMKRSAAELRSDRGRLSGHLCECTLGYLSVFQSGQLQRESRRLNKNSRQLARTALGRMVRAALLRQHYSLLLHITLLGTIVIAQQNSSNKGELAPLLLVYVLIFNALRDISRSWDYAITYHVARKRLQAVIARTRPAQQEKNNQLKRRIPLAITLRDLQLLPESEPLRFAADAGSTILLSGESGSGKSLLTLLLARQLEPESGRIVIQGRRLEWLNRTSVARCIKLINEESMLFRGTIAGNIRYGRPGAEQSEVALAARQAGVPAGLLRQEVMEMGRGLPSELKARVMLARALLEQPGLLLIDLPLFSQRQALADTLNILQRKRALTLLVVGDIRTTTLHFDHHCQLYPPPVKPGSAK